MYRYRGTFGSLSAAISDKPFPRQGSADSCRLTACGAVAHPVYHPVGCGGVEHCNCAKRTQCG